MPQWKVRFSVGAPGEEESSIWGVTSYRNDVYVITSTMGKIQKVSFHESGICRVAFVEAHGAPRGMDDRCINKWRRNATPKKGSLLPTRLLSVTIPVDYLTTSKSAPPNKKIHWIQRGEATTAITVDLFLTRESVDDMEKVKQNRTMISNHHLPSGELAVLWYFRHPWNNDELKAPRSPDGGNNPYYRSVFRDLLFSSHDPYGTGRPIRIQFWKPPADGDALHVFDVGGYEVPQT